MVTAQYPQALTEQALGNDALSVVPELVRIAELRGPQHSPWTG